MVTATVYCFPTFFRWTVIATYCLISLWGLQKVISVIKYFLELIRGVGDYVLY